MMSRLRWARVRATFQRLGLSRKAVARLRTRLMSTWGASRPWQRSKVQTSTSSLALTSVENHGANLFSDGTTQGMGSLSSGTLTLKVHQNQTVMAGVQYAFSFTILNPITAQDASTVTIEASGTAEFLYDRGAMSTDKADLNGVTNGGKPITVVSK